jgi:RNA polymerase sigma factor (sigma-70 family)
MANGALGTVVRRAVDLAADWGAGGRSDADLLRAYAAGGDEAAFAALVRRHGSMVMGVCRRALGQEQDAEDAFQATFILLARNAGSVRKPGSLGDWLHGVAYRMAMNAKRAAGRRRRHEGTSRPPRPDSPAMEAALREVRALLDEEVARLPDVYRAAFILCCLEQRSCADASRALGVKEATVWSRVARARRLLQAGLARRGITLATVLAAAALPSGRAAAVSGPLVCSTVRAAAGGSIPPDVTTLLEGATMSAIRPKLAAVLTLTLAVAAAGFAMWAVPGPATPPPGQPNAVRSAKDKVERPDAPKSAGGGAFDGTVADAVTGQPGGGLTVTVRRAVAGNPAGEVKLTTEKTGRFRFELPADWADPPNARLAVTVQTPAGYVGLPYRTQYGSPTEDGVPLAELRGEKAIGVPPYFDRILLFPAKEVQGRVLDPAGKPAAGVDVVVCSVHLKDKAVPPHRVVRRAKTDADGRFAAEVASPGPAVLYLLPDQHAVRVVKLTDPAGNLGEYKLDAGVEVAGKLRDARDRPLPGRWVRVGTTANRLDIDEDLWNVGLGSLARWCRTGPDGTFHAPPLPPGEYEASAHDPGGDPVAGRERAGEPLAACVLPAKVTVRADRAPDRVVLRAVPHVNVEMRVADRDGKPRDGIGFFPRFTFDGKEYRSVAAGWPVPGRDGRAVLRVPHGTSALEVFVSTGEAAVTCRLRPGQGAARELATNVYLEKLEGDQTLEFVWARGADASLRVTTKDGTSLPAEVSVDARHSSIEHCSSVPVADGLYRLYRVEAGRELRITVRAEGWEAVTRTVTLPAGTPQQVEVALEKKLDE